ncbi:histone deacetylase family protein [Candidatus Pelagibacter communis]|uniref:histone deacetylase family protein n=1 Tax=Pelagibacter ubique TaxID=198252 RepID=UPI00094C643E|nr:histone deacetylase family protein [Candidatus Pelagibacter ubique]
MIVYSHTDCLLKYNGKNHPERKERIDSIMNSIKSSDLNINFKDAPIADIETISLVHPKKYIEQIFEKIPKEGIIGVEKEPYADTMLCPNSKNAILRSCGSGIAACDDLMNKNERVFCAIRPPGHHAETIRANGFCYINNVAVAAKYLQTKYKINKIAIIDFDVHHGNGTQEIFYKDGSVAYASSHEFPLFPGTGTENETGVGNIFNATLKAGIKSKEFHEIFEKKVLSPIEKFKPEVILISAGFDAHKRDPLANINLESNDFLLITKKIVDIANIHSKGRVISFLEGGYDLQALSESIIEHLKALKTHI